MGFSRQEYWNRLPFPSPVDHILSDLSWHISVRPFHLGWPHMAWLNFTELDKAVVCVIRLASFLWLWFQCVCPLMLSHNTYHLTWVSLTLDLGHLFMAAQAKCSHCSLASHSSWPWTGVAPLRPPAPLKLQLLGCGVSPLGHSCAWYAAAQLPATQHRIYIILGVLYFTVFLSVSSHPYLTAFSKIKFSRSHGIGFPAALSVSGILWIDSCTFTLLSGNF